MTTLIDILNALQGLLKAQCPEGIGYSLWVLQGEPEKADVASMLYVSSGNRADVCTMLEETMLKSLPRWTSSDDMGTPVADETSASRAFRESHATTLQRMRRIVKLNFPDDPPYDHVLILFDYQAGGNMAYDTSLHRAVLGSRLAYWVTNQRERMRNASK